VKLLVIGASGGIGREVVRFGVARGLSITALVRSPEKLASLGAAVRIVAGDPLDARDVSEAAAGHDAVVSCLGAPGVSPTTVHADGARALVLGLPKGERVVLVSAAMLFPSAGLLALVLRTTILRHVATDSLAAEEMLAKSALRWTVVRPPRLTDGSPEGTWRTAEGRLPERSRGAIRRSDVADCLLHEASTVTHVGKVLGVGACPR
jgi:putative NADH-flavin reductase